MTILPKMLQNSLNHILQEMYMNNKYKIAIGLSILLLVCSCSEYKQMTYKNLKEVDTNQSLWLPFFLLDSNEIKGQVYNYFECHDLDTNESWGYFSLHKNESLFSISYNLETANYNVRKVEKRLKKIGYELSFDNIRLISNGQISYYLFFDAKQNKFYFYGFL